MDIGLGVPGTSHDCEDKCVSDTWVPVMGLLKHQVPSPHTAAHHPTRGSHRKSKGDSHAASASSR